MSNMPMHLNSHCLVSIILLRKRKVENQPSFPTQLYHSTFHATHRYSLWPMCRFQHRCSCNIVSTSGRDITSFPHYSINGLTHQSIKCHCCFNVSWVVALCLISIVFIVELCHRYFLKEVDKVLYGWFWLWWIVITNDISVNALVVIS